MNTEQAAGFKIRIYPEVVTPERFYPGVHQSFAWIPAKSMRE